MLNSILTNFIGQAPDSVIEYVEYIDSNHITGSLGQVKTITDKDSAGNIMKVTNFYYTNTTYPAKVTRIIITGGA